MTTTDESTGYIADDSRVVLVVTTTNTNTTLSSLDPIISDDQRQVIVFTLRVVIGQIVALLGMGSNIVNILVFYKMGFKESMNISLFGLAISDFMSCLTFSWGNVCYTPAFNKLDLPFRPLEIKYLTEAIPHYVFVKISGCVTAYVAFERCLCVAFPLRVKNIITPKRVTILIVGAYVFILALYASVYYVGRLAWKFYPEFNKSLVGVVFRPDRRAIERYMLPVRGSILTWFLFVFIIISTVVMVATLKKKSEWRIKVATSGASSSSTAANQISSRDARVSTMVVMVSIVFIVCFTPQTMSVIAMSMVPEISVNGSYSNLWSVLFSINNNLESVNASVNIFIYYLRSSKYKAMFDHIFFKKTITD